MTKDEFLLMVKYECFRLEEEWYQVHGKIYELKKNNQKGKILESAERKAEILSSRKMSLINHLNLPAYERIQAMSDIEIDNYRKEKSANIENEIDEIQTKLKVLTEQYEHSKEGFKQYMNEYEMNHPDFDGRISKLPVDGQDLHQNLFRVKQYCENFSKELESKRKEQEELKKMTSLEIKQQLSSKIKGFRQLEEQSELAKKTIHPVERLESEVAFNIDESRKLASLETSYRKLAEEIRQGKSNDESKKEELAKQIKNFNGKTEIELPSEFADEYEHNLKHIITSAQSVYRSDFINRVKQEAQNQADIEEARLRGLTVEQLKEMKQQLMANGSTVENAEEEMSHGMKR